MLQCGRVQWFSPITLSTGLDSVIEAVEISDIRLSSIETEVAKIYMPGICGNFSTLVKY